MTQDQAQHKSVNNFKHCQPCTDFDLCYCCNQETCQDCGETLDSPHCHLTEESQDALDELIKEDLLMPGRICHECLFYAYHNINDQEQESYNHSMIFHIKEERIQRYDSYRGNVIEIKKSVVITGKKPEPDFPIIRGPFILKPIEQEHPNDLESSHRTR